MVATRYDRKRGCGWRKPGGLYLVAPGLGRHCGKLPIPLTICPTCGGGIHFSRSWTWVNADALLGVAACATGGIDCERCPLAKPLGRCGLLWVGGRYYPEPEDWINEALLQGVSRRITNVPRDFVAGETWVLVAHARAIIEHLPGEERCTPGIFHAFRPSAIEYVTKGSETDEQLAALEGRGITPVRVVRCESGEEVPA